MRANFSVLTLMRVRENRQRRAGRQSPKMIGAISE